MSLLNSRRFWVLLVVVGGFAVRLLAIGFLHIEPDSDFAHYVNMAATLAATGEMRDLFGNVAYYSAGYPLFLAPSFALFGAGPETAQLGNAVLGGLSIWLVYLCAARLLPDWRWALLAAALWAAYPPSILYTEYVAKENLMVPLLLLQLYLSLLLAGSRRRSGMVIALGMVFGAGLLVGAAIVFTGGIIALVILLAGPRPAPAARLGQLLLFAVVSVLTLSPWLAYTDARLGEPVINTNGPFNLYLGNNPNNDTPYYMGIEDTPMAADWHALRAELGELAAMRELGELAKAHMLEHPGRTVGLALTKVVTFWYPPLHSGRDGDGSALETVVRRVWLAFYLLLVALALVPLVFWRRLDAQYLIVYGTVLAYCAVHGIAYVIFRYRLPVMPMVTVLAAAGAWLLFERFLRRQRRSKPSS